MLIFAEAKIPVPAKHKLAEYGELIEFSTSGITYDSISGHPDIFFCKYSDVKGVAGLVVAPNIPGGYIEILRNKGVNFVKGEKDVGREYPLTATYNAVLNKGRLIHRSDITDGVLLEMAPEIIEISQGYARCSLIELKGDAFLTSDAGIYKTLSLKNYSVVYVNPDKIILPGFKNGFLGGCCGIEGSRVFICGSLNYIGNENEVRHFLAEYNYEVIELYDGPLFDCGSILFL